MEAIFRHDAATAVRTLIMRYAQCVDRRDCDGFAALFTEDAILGDDNFSYDTPEAIRAVPKSMEVYAKTYHVVWNHLSDLSNDSGTGEVYSAAHHLIPQPDGSFIDMVMYITYRDNYVRRGDQWFIQCRHMKVEFVERHPAERFQMTPELERLRHLT